MPVFFLVGGYVNAQSWTAHHAAGRDLDPVGPRPGLRLLWPTAVFLVVGELAVAVARAAGAPAGPRSPRRAGSPRSSCGSCPLTWLLIALTPVLLAAHQRWGLAVPAVMAAAAGLVDIAALSAHLPTGIGYAELRVRVGLRSTSGASAGRTGR